METLSVTAKLAKNDEIKAADVLFKNCWLGGSPLLLEDATLKMTAIGQLNQLTGSVKAELKNL